MAYRKTTAKAPQNLPRNIPPIPPREGFAVAATRQREGRSRRLRRPAIRPRANFPSRRNLDTPAPLFRAWLSRSLPAMPRSLTPIRIAAYEGGIP